MTAGEWEVRLAERAQRDFDAIVDWTRETFGANQARDYVAVILDAVEALAEGPLLPGSIDRGELGEGLRSVHVARGRHRGRHLLLYRPGPHRSIDVLRILHDRMELARHVNANQRQDTP